MFFLTGDKKDAVPLWDRIFVPTFLVRLWKYLLLCDILK